MGTQKERERERESERERGLINTRPKLYEKSMSGRKILKDRRWSNPRSTRETEMWKHIAQENIINKI